MDLSDFLSATGILLVFVQETKERSSVRNLTPQQCLQTIVKMRLDLCLDKPSILNCLPFSELAFQTCQAFSEIIFQY